MSALQIHALATGLVVLFVAILFFVVISIAFPNDKNGPRGGGMVE